MGSQGGGFRSVSRARLVEILIEHALDCTDGCDCGWPVPAGLTDDEARVAHAEHVADVVVTPRVREMMR